MPFHPYYTVKDGFYVGGFLIIAAFIVFFAPAMGGWFLEHDNFTEANKLVTPAHIKPVWYYTPYYAMLRVVPHKLSGVLVMFGAIAILFLVPWLDRAKVKSYRYRGLDVQGAAGCSRSASSGWARSAPARARTRWKPSSAAS